MKHLEIVLVGWIIGSVAFWAFVMLWIRKQ